MRDPNILRSVRINGERACLEVSEMPGRETVRVEISDPERDADDPFGTMSIDLTPEQWQELRNLTGDFIEAPPAPQPADPAPSRPTPLRSVGKSERDDDSSVH